MENPFSDIEREIGIIVNSDVSWVARLRAICDLLRERVPHYDWVGFYVVTAPLTLTLGPYSGEATEHTEIPFGRGVCGRVAESEETLVIGDVSGEANYLSCSVNVKSEIVVPIFKGGVFAAQLDIDSRTVNAFTAEDRFFLENVARILEILF